MKNLNRKQGFFDEAFETRSREERLKSHDHQVVEIVKHAYAKCQAFRERLAVAHLTADDIIGTSDLARIPVFHKDELIKLQGRNPPFGGLLGVPEDEISWIFMSPGPIFDLEVAADESRVRAIARAFFSGGFRKGDKVLNTWSYHLGPMGMWNDLALRYMGCTVIPTGTGNTELQVQILKHLKATGFVGTTGFLMNVLKKAEEMKLDPRKDLNLQVAMVGGEAAGGPMRKLFEEEYRITSGDYYGTADVGLIAYECRERSGMHLNEDIIVEIVDPQTGKPVPPGEAGEVVITNFYRAYPLIRFGTGDLSKGEMEYCPCGRTSPRLTKILGRIGDAVRVRGMFVHLNQSEQVMASFAEIGPFQIVVSRPAYRDHLKLRIELKGEVIDRGVLKQSLSDRFREICRVSPDEIIFLEPGELADEKKMIDVREY